MALYEVLAARGEAEAGAAAHVVSLLEAGSGPQRETITLVLLHIRWQQCIIAPRELKYRRMKLHFEHSVVQVRGNWGYGGASRGAKQPRCSPRRPHPLGEAEAYNRRAPSENHAGCALWLTILERRNHNNATRFLPFTAQCCLFESVQVLTLRVSPSPLVGRLTAPHLGDYVYVTSTLLPHELVITRIAVTYTVRVTPQPWSK